VGVTYKANVGQIYLQVPSSWIKFINQETHCKVI